MHKLLLMTGLALTLSLSAQMASASADTSELKATLQASMQRDLERRMVDGGLPHVDFETGDVTLYYPTERHPRILTMGDHYVMCAELLTKDGVRKTVDFYLAKNGRRYTIFHTVIGDRGPLKKLIKAGVAKPLK